MRLFRSFRDVLSAYVYSCGESRTVKAPILRVSASDRNPAAADAAAGLNVCNSCSFPIGPQRPPITVSAGFRTAQAANRMEATETRAGDPLLTFSK